MRVAFMTHGFPPREVAGVELYSRAVARELRRSGVDCVVLAGSTATATTPALSTSIEDGMPVTRLLSPVPRPMYRALDWDPVSEPLIREFLVQSRPDVVHVQHWFRLGPRLVAPSAELGIPAVVTLADQFAVCPRFHRRRANLMPCTAPYTEDLCLPCVDREPWEDDAEVGRALSLRHRWFARELALASRLLAPSSFAADFFSQLSGLPRSRVEVLPLPWLHEERPGPPPAQRPEGPLRVGHWGHLLPAKGTHLLVLAARELEPVEVHLWGPVAPGYAEYLASLAGGARLVFHGPYQPADLYGAPLDVAVFPSLSPETYSFAVDEALALGRPVIVPDQGAPVERIGPRGLTFRAGSVVDLTRTLREVARRREEAATVRPETRAPAGLEEHARALVEVYRSLRPPKEDPRMPQTRIDDELAHLRAQVQARDEHLAGLLRRDAELGEDNARLHETYRALEAEHRGAVEARVRLELEHRRLEGAYAAMEGAHRALEGEHTALAAEMSRLREDYRRLEEHDRALLAMVEEIRASRSWKALTVLQRARRMLGRRR